MDRQEFIRRFEATDDVEEATPANCRALVGDYLAMTDPVLVASGSEEDIERSLKYVIVEELAELAQQVSKDLRGKGDRTCLLEELADVAINVRIAQSLYGIDDEELARAMSVKLQRTREIR